MKSLSAAVLTVTLLSAACASKRPATFATPDDALRGLVLAEHDEASAEKILGRGGYSLLHSGDDVADRQDLDAVQKLLHQRVEFEDVAADRKIALLGNDRWEFPIPLVLEDGRWTFDVETGRQEIHNRRIGRNELSTLATLRAIVEAQREYAAEPRDGHPRAFADRLMSSEGRHDGLYWPVPDGGEPSPLGTFVAEAFDEGYRVKKGSGPTPYHGYLFRLLTEAGPSAPGGARSYRDSDGRLTRGFAVVAWPAEYGNSGVMTFLVNQQGIVFQKDLGSGTDRLARAIQAYDPDTSWAPTGD